MCFHGDGEITLLMIRGIKGEEEERGRALGTLLCRVRLTSRGTTDIPSLFSSCQKCETSWATPIEADQHLSLRRGKRLINFFFRHSLCRSLHLGHNGSVRNWIRSDVTLLTTRKESPIARMTAKKKTNKKTKEMAKPHGWRPPLEFKMSSVLFRPFYF